MPKATVNTFEGGMNKDLSKVVHTKNTTLDSVNFRPVTDEEGIATGGLVNIEGNDLSFTIPQTMEVFEFQTDFTDPFPANVNIEITVGTTTHNEVLAVDGIDNSTYRDSLVDAINTNLDFNAIGIVAYASESDMIVITTTTISSTFSVTLLSPELIGLSSSVAPQSGLQIIGWSALRDDIVLFTTNDDTAVGGPGQIWRLVIDPITRNTTLTLVYNNNINFTILHPIEALARYETAEIQKVYWTDNFNKVRFLNISDSNAFGTPIENLDLLPVIDHSVAVLQEITTGGSLITGVYQYAYRLRASSGGETSFSRLSRIIPINPYPETTTNYWEYVGGDSEQTTGKAVQMKIENLDTDFDFVEIVALYKKDEFTEPTVTALFTENIPANGELTFTHTGSEQNAIELTVDEFRLATTTFTHAKTLAAKDNRLFVGNVRNEAIDIGDYDTRAYGFDGAGSFSVDGVVRTSAQFGDVEETDDAINDDFDVYKFKDGGFLYGGTGPNISFEIKTRTLKADQKILFTDGSEYEGLPMRTVGANTTTDIDLSEGRTYPQSAVFPDGMRNPHMFDLLRGYMRDETYRFAIVFLDKQGNPGFANWIADVKIPPVFDSRRSVYGTDDYINGSFDGKTIRQASPDTSFSINYEMNIPYVEFDVTLTQDLKDKISGYTIVRVDRTDADKTIVGQGLAFPIGAKIDIDEAGGVDVSSTINDLETLTTYMFAGSNHRDQNTPLTTLTDPRGGTPASASIAAETKDLSYMTIQFPDHMLTDNIDFKTGDKIKTVDVLGCDNAIITDSNATFPYTPTTIAVSGILDDNYRPTPAASTEDEYSINIRKVYKESAGGNLYGQAPTAFVDPADNEVRFIGEFFKVPRRGAVVLPDGTEFRNETSQVFRTSTPTPINGAYGEKTILVRMYDDDVFTTPTGIHTYVGSGGLNGATWKYNQYIVNYVRDLVAQYGGNTYAQRANNIYIGTGNFIAVNDDSSLSSTFDVQGGDISMGVFDTQKFIKIWDTTLALDVEHTKMAQVYGFPVESPINVDLRTDKYPFANGLLDDGTNSTTDGNNQTLTGTIDLGEDFEYNKVYSLADNTISYFSKPLEFILNNEFDTRIYASDIKFNGESTDSWTFFRVNNFLDLEGLYGPLNKLSILNDSMITFQDCAVSMVAINPRAVVQGSDGINLELGEGNVLHDFTYASTSIGCKHQWGIVTGKKSLYWLDINTNKFYRFTGSGIEPLSDIKGLYSHFNDTLKWEVRLPDAADGDNPLIGRGITGYYDSVNNEAVLTFVGTTVPQVFNIGSTYQVGDLVVDGFDTYEVTTAFTATALNLKANANIIFNGFTVAFNEFGDAFTSFYDQKSVIYPHNKRHIFSPNHLDRVSVYQHNIGDRCSFYGTVYDSSLKFITNDLPLNTKTFDNIAWHSEVTTPTGVSIDDTLDTITFNTDYQETGLQTLTIGTNVKRKERTWQMAVPRSTTNRERLRDKYMEVEATYDNTANNRMVLHYAVNSFRPSFR